MTTRKKTTPKEDKIADEQAQIADEEKKANDGLKPATVSVGAGYTALNIRNEPTKSAKILKTVPDGTSVLAGEDDGGWCAVEVGDISGFTMVEFLERS